MHKQIQIITIQSELGAGTEGASMGAVRLTEFFSNPPISEFAPIFLKGEGKTTPLYPEAKHIEKFALFAENQIAPALCSACQQGHFPLILSGDHANAIGVISGIQQANPNAKIGVLWIDAHSDIHTPYTTPSGNLHGMSLAALTRTDNLAHAVNPKQKEIDNFWQSLKQLAPKHSGLQFADLAFIGLRSFENPEIALIREKNIQVWEVSELRKIGIENLAKQVETHFQDVDLLVISFDVDVMNGEYFQATGTPVPQGLELHEAQKLLKRLIQIPKLYALEITEFNPILDAKSSHWVEELCREIKNDLQQRFA